MRRMESEMDERRGGRQALCLRVCACVCGSLLTVQLCVQSKHNRHIVKKRDLLLFFLSHFVFSMFNNQVIFFLAINSLMR